MSLDAIKRQTVDRRARNINIVGPATSINQRVRDSNKQIIPYRIPLLNKEERGAKHRV
jgi:hypothetical protein